MKRRIKNKIHRQFNSQYALEEGYFQSQKKKRSAIIADLAKQLDSAMDYYFSRYCR